MAIVDRPTKKQLTEQYDYLAPDFSEVRLLAEVNERDLYHRTLALEYGSETGK